MCRVLGVRNWQKHITQHTQNLIRLDVAQDDPKFIIIRHTTVDFRICTKTENTCTENKRIIMQSMLAFAKYDISHIDAILACWYWSHQNYKLAYISTGKHIPLFAEYGCTDTRCRAASFSDTRRSPSSCTVNRPHCATKRSTRYRYGARVPVSYEHKCGWSSNVYRSHSEESGTLREQILCRFLNQKTKCNVSSAEAT